MAADPAQTTPIISTFADDPDMQELVALFVDEMPTRIAAVEKAHHTGDLKLLARLAHQLKGSAPGYGFDAVGESAGSLEASLHDAENDASVAGDIKDQIDELTSELLSVCKRVSRAN